MKRALITGAARGIGKAIAERYSGEGYELVCPTREQVDLADIQQVESYVASLHDIDVLINNAGENVPLPLEEISPSALQRIVNVNEVAPFLLARALGVAMAQRGWGRIVNVSSVYSLVSRPRRSMYTMTKSAINGLTRALAVELGPRNVLVNAVCPGFIDTALTRQNNTDAEIEALCANVPLRRLGSVSEIADLVFFLGSERNTYISGQAIAIDGGFLCQ